MCADFVLSLLPATYTAAFSQPPSTGQGEKKPVGQGRDEEIAHQLPQRAKQS